MRNVGKVRENKQRISNHMRRYDMVRFGVEERENKNEREEISTVVTLMNIKT